LICFGALDQDENLSAALFISAVKFTTIENGRSVQNSNLGRKHFA